MCGKGFDFRGWQDTKNIYERLNQTPGGLPEEHKEVLDAVLEIKEYIKKEDPNKIKNIFNKAIRYFGYTTNLNETGYILPNGKLLDLSGKKQGGPWGKRYLDHREVSHIIDMVNFVSMGAIRYFPETPGVDIRKPPTPKQLNIIWKSVNESGSGFSLEMTSPYKARFFEQYDSGVKSEKIINVIRKYYNNSA